MPNETHKSSDFTFVHLNTKCMFVTCYNVTFLKLSVSYFLNPLMFSFIHTRLSDDHSDGKVILFLS